MFPSALIRAVAFIFAAAVLPVTGAPFVPQSDNQILEHLPFAPNDPVIRELGALRDGLKNEPHDLPLAVRLAQAYIGPRYRRSALFGLCAGRACAVVGPQPAAR